MLNFFKRSSPILAGSADNRSFATEPGQRVYAIGDIHGRLDLFAKMLERIDADDRKRGGDCETLFILLGDLIDRGPHSASVIEATLLLMRERLAVTLAGNHEEVFGSALEGNLQALRFFLKIGGQETLLSYGMTKEFLEISSLEDIYVAMLKAVPEAHQHFVRDLPDFFQSGDYLFVHAGIRPKIPIEDQEKSDLHWIREDFLSSRVAHPQMVIHGHTITAEIDERSNRIGLDTGAYQTGRLSAIGLQNFDRWYLSIEHGGTLDND